MSHDETCSLVKRVIGRNVRALRIASGYNQTRFAEMIGVNRSYMSLIECGKMNVSVNVLLKIADGLDKPLTALFDGLESCAPRQLPRDTTYSAVKIPK